MTNGFNRRAFLQKGSCIAVAAMAGCAGGPDQSGNETDQTAPNTIFVDTDGELGGSGTADDPKQSIQLALEEAMPGDTIQVRPGRYQPPSQVTTERAGTESDPITITGPPEAVYVSEYPFEINHSHVHLTGLTFDGLYKPAEPEDPRSYGESMLQVNESLYERIKGSGQTSGSVSEENYLTDVVVKPHALGNCGADMIKVHYSKNVEIGEFKVFGPAGVNYIKGDMSDHNGEIVYVGNPPAEYPLDETHNVHIHHIDASEGYGHAELVDLKSGTHHCTVEYCTSAGGGRTSDEATPVVISHNGHHNVVRWNEIYECAIPVEFDAEYPDKTYENDLYGNYFHDFSDVALAFEDREKVNLQQQGHVCGNRVEATAQSLTKQCEVDLPTGSGVGHTGGESPWT